MYSKIDKSKDTRSKSSTNMRSQTQRSEAFTFQPVGDKTEEVTQRKQQGIAHNSPQTIQLQAFQQMANNNPRNQKVAQLQDIAQNNRAQTAQPVQKQENKTGLPDNLKAGMERLSGISLDDVKVHRNSDKPAQLKAHAYAQGTDIHLGAGQEKHLPHEAWHVVQQKQGRVQPTVQMKGKVKVNDNTGLEREADIMGAKSLEMSNQGNMSMTTAPLSSSNQVQSNTQQGVVQGMFLNGEEFTDVGSVTGDKTANELYDELVNVHGLNHDEEGHHVQAFLELLTTDRVFPSVAHFIRAINITSLSVVLPGIDTPPPHPSLAHGISLAPSRKKKRKGKAKRAKKMTSTVITSSATLTGLGTGLVIDKLTGTSVKEGLPISMKRKVETKIGQFFNVLGGLSEAIIPIVGGTLAAPFTGIGSTMEAHGKGMSKKQSAFQGAAKAGAGAGIGAIPVWGNIDGVAGLLDSGQALFGKIKSPSKMEAIIHLRGVMATMNGIIDEVGAGTAFDDAEFAALYSNVEHYLAKYEEIVAEKIDSGTASLLKYDGY